MQRIFLSKICKLIHPYPKLIQLNFKYYSISKTPGPPPKNQNGVLLMDPGLPNECDMMLSDVKEKHLYSEIAKKLNITYLENVERRSEEELHGVLWGQYSRVMVPIIMDFVGMRKKVIFLVDTGSPRTYISEHVFGSFQQVKESATIFLNGHELFVLMSPENSHFADVNVLGSDFLKLVNAKLVVFYENNIVQITGNFKTDEVFAIL